jgi:cyanophycinase
MSLSSRLVLSLLLGAAPTLLSPQPAAAYRYVRVGNAANAAATPQAGFALMGGGTDLDEAFKFLCNHAGGGDLLVLRATGTDAYNPYIQGLCHLNSVATLVIPSRDAASNPFVAETISHASALFIAGGDQSNYINFWQGTPVQTALNAAIAHGVPIGGTSAGLAVLGEHVYTAQGDKPDGPDLDAKTALADPYGPRITLGGHFLDVPLLKGVITDSHFAKRNRMGRLLVFLARLSEPEGKPIPPPGLNIRGIGIDERAAVLLEPDGKAKVIGQGVGAWFVSASRASGLTLTRNQPLTFGPFDVEKVAPGQNFNLATWTGEGTQYRLTAKSGNVQSSQPNGAIY